MHLSPLEEQRDLLGRSVEYAANHPARACQVPRCIQGSRGWKDVATLAQRRRRLLGGEKSAWPKTRYGAICYFARAHGLRVLVDFDERLFTKTKHSVALSTADIGSGQSNQIGN
jgi:hypothetical protein